MVNTINVNGRAVKVLNTLSVGPGCAPHTYELAGGSYVHEIAGQWFLQVRGQRAVAVEVAR